VNEKMRKTKPLSYETAMRNLEDMVHRLENEQLPLEDALQSFEKGIEMLRICYQRLEQAQTRVEVLLETVEKERSIRKEIVHNEQT